MVGDGRNGLFWWGLGVVGVAGFVGVVDGLFVVGDEGVTVTALTHIACSFSVYPICEIALARSLLRRRAASAAVPWCTT